MSASPPPTSPTPEHSVSDLRLYRRLLRHALPYKWPFLIAIVGMLAVAAGDASVAALLQPIVDDGLVGRDVAFIVKMLIFLAGLAFVRAFGTFIDIYCSGWVARCVIRDLRQLMFEQLIRAPVQFYDQNASGSLTARLIYHVEQVAASCTSALRTVFRDAAKTLFLLGLMFSLSWKLSLLFAIIFPVAYFIFKASSSRFRSISHRVQESVADVTHASTEALQGQRVVKTFGAFQYQRSVFLNANNRARRQAMKAFVVEALTVSLMVFISGLGVAGVIWFAFQQDISTGAFISYLTAMIMVTKPVRNLSKVNLIIQGGLAAAQSVFETIDLQREPDGGEIVLGGIENAVQFKNVSFQYESADKPVLTDISFEIKADTTVALVGMSGGGKSTIASLLLRFYSPTAGQILIDGKSLDTLTLDSLRANIAVVTQEIILFDDTISNNIAYGESGKINRQKLISAAAAANVLEFVEDMPDGLETMVGEQGVRLSGGQRQRIAIARALYKDAPILIMDEATSSLDSHSEQHIRDAIASLVKNRTSLIIAHRLSTIEQADEILVMESGKVVQQGTHAELLKRGGEYARLHSAQHREQSPVA